MRKFPEHPFGYGAIDGPASLAHAPPPCQHQHLAHKITAGFPSPAADYIEDGLDLNEYLVPNKCASFLFTVAGDSMRDAGILDGDKVIVDRSVPPTHGKIVIAVIDSEYTLKRLHSVDGTIELRSENPAYASIRMVEGSTLEVWGVVVGSIRRYRG
ncbi:LexA family protein [Massilia glaciei]|uniref:Peptidase n=1 Tax=Massilia glaciei TaxID=1524097 RepID=A0A2U2I5E8_9BURK|nr:translesion error-prone DNA polymerase V autoproteolytic subunit [Massilia glaciei]PWF54981.1 peptidase [Massilia glaciei]